MTDVVIIGGGISGCAAAQALQSAGADYLLIEKNVEPGGLTRSINIAEAVFDYTGHYLHLARCSNPGEIPYAGQNSEDWQKIRRKSVVYMEGSIVPAPFQYNLYALPVEIRNRCIAEYHARRATEVPKSFKDYLLSGFGSSICEMFLFPYNEKQLALSIDELSLDAVKRFFPYPDRDKIERGYLGAPAESYGYNSYFWYPKKNGIGILSKGIANGLKELKTCCNVRKVGLSGKVLHTSCGNIRYKRLMSSVPLKWLCLNCDDLRLQNLARSLSNNSVLCLNLLCEKPWVKELEGCHWIYIKEKDIPFYRVGVYSNIPTRIWCDNHTALYVEIAYSESRKLKPMEDILQDVFTALQKLGWMNRKDCIIIAANWIDCAYVHYDRRRKESVAEIMEILKEYDVFPIGRYGLWDYMSMEDSIYSGIEVARKVIQNR